MTQEFIGFLFDLDDSRGSRFIKKLEPLLARVMTISKVKTLSKEKAGFLILDGTERPTKRPKNGQKAYYSGKKKRYTLQTEIPITAHKKIVHVSKCKPGLVHDFAIYKAGLPVPHGTTAYADTEISYKASKNKPQNDGEKDYNMGLSFFRIRIGNVLTQRKVFRTPSELYRNKRNAIMSKSLSLQLLLIWRRVLLFIETL